MNWSNSKVRFRDTSRLVFQELQERHLVGRNSMVGLLNIATFIEENRISVGLKCDHFIQKFLIGLSWSFESLWVTSGFFRYKHTVEGFLRYNNCIHWSEQNLGWDLTVCFFSLKFSMRSSESSCDIWVLPFQTCTDGCRK